MKHGEQLEKTELNWVSKSTEDRFFWTGLCGPFLNGSAPDLMYLDITGRWLSMMISWPNSEVSDGVRRLSDRISVMYDTPDSESSSERRSYGRARRGRRMARIGPKTEARPALGSLWTAKTQSLSNNQHS